MKFSKIAIITTAMVMLLSFSVFAGPIDKGSMILGGGFEFGSWSGDLYENSEGDGQTSFAFFPGVSYFFMPSLAIGADIGFSSASQGDMKNSGFGFGPHVVYFFDLNKDVTETKGKIYPYFGASFMYNSMTYDSGVPDAEDVKTTMTTFSAFGGGNFMVSEAVAVFGQVKYDSDSWSPEEGDSVSGSGFGFNVGVRAFIF